MINLLLTELVEEIEGDLYEEFMDNSERYGHAKAKRLYSWTVVRSLRPYLIKYVVFTYQPYACATCLHTRNLIDNTQ